MSSYPLSLINMLVSGGLLLLHIPLSGLASQYAWNPPFKAYRAVITFFFVSNIFLVFAPLVPPAPGFRPYQTLPYWVRTYVSFPCASYFDLVYSFTRQLHVFTAVSISFAGMVYWYIRCRWLPARGGYQVVPHRVLQKDGESRTIMKKVLLD